MRQLEVYVNEVKAGLLTELNPGKGYTFAYNAEYVASDFPPVSLSLPKRTETYAVNTEMLLSLNSKSICSNGALL